MAGVAGRDARHDPECEPRASNLNTFGTRLLRKLLEFVEVPEVGRKEMLAALGFSMSDLEDAMQVAAALAGGAEFVVTRNLRDYRRSPIPACAPAEALKRLQNR